MTKAKDRILYPFGYGLSYTSFSLEAKRESDGKVTCIVTNTGKYPGKEVVQVYMKTSGGKLNKADRVLVGYAKTKSILPGECDVVSITFSEADYASFDSEGVTGYKDSFVLEAGEYTCFIGTDSIRNEELYSFHIEKTVCVQKCLSIREDSRKERIQASLPKEIAQTGDRRLCILELMSTSLQE